MCLVCTRRNKLVKSNRSLKIVSIFILIGLYIHFEQVYFPDIRKNRCAMPQVYDLNINNYTVNTLERIEIMHPEAIM